MDLSIPKVLQDMRKHPKTAEERRKAEASLNQDRDSWKEAGREVLNFIAGEPWKQSLFLRFSDCFPVYSSYFVAGDSPYSQPFQKILQLASYLILEADKA